MADRRGISIDVALSILTQLHGDLQRMVVLLDYCEFVLEKSGEAVRTSNHKKWQIENSAYHKVLESVSVDKAWSNVGDNLGITIGTYELSKVLDIEQYAHYLEAKEAENWYELRDLFSFTTQEWQKILPFTNM